MSGLPALQHFGMTVTPGGTVYVLGGYTGMNQGGTSDVYALLPPGDGGMPTWQGTGAGLGTARAFLTAVSDLQGRIYAIGGATNTAEYTPILANSIERWDPDAGGQFTSLSALPRGGRSSAAAAYDPVSDSIYVFMGYVASGTGGGTDTRVDNGYDIYSVEAGTWRTCLADGGCVSCPSDGTCPSF